MRKRSTFFLVPVLILLTAAACGIIFIRSTYACYSNTDSLPIAEASPTPEPTPEIKPVTVYYLTPAGTINGPTVIPGTSVCIEAGPEIDNYTFLYWKDAQGNIETRCEIQPLEDTWYSAVYTVALNCDDHIAYLSTDENGLLNLDGAVSRRELAEVLYSLLKVKVKGSDCFDDVSSEDSCYAAVSALKSLGVVSGIAYRPDDSSTLRDVLSMLCSFYPNTGDFSDTAICENAEMLGWSLPGDDFMNRLDRAITRAEFATLINRVLGRSFNGVYPDGNSETQGEDYRNVLEACTIHSYVIENGFEKWTEYQALEDFTPGFMLVDYTLYYINENRTLLKNGEVNGFLFDSEGRYTSGDSELDAMVRAVVEKYRQDDGDMTALLHRIFNHIAFDSNFISSKHFYSTEDIPTVELAKRLLSDSKGNCYNYSAAFIQIVRSLGYDASWVIGNVRGEPGVIEHGWVQMPVDGEMFYFDPEMEPICRPKGLTAFMMTEQRSRELGFLIVAGKQ